MRLFYRCFPIRDTLRHELTWSHYRRLISVEDVESESPFFTYFRREKTFFSYFFGIFKKSFYLCLRNDNKTRMH
jgi:hypothetical protein